MAGLGEMRYANGKHDLGERGRNREGGGGGGETRARARETTLPCQQARRDARALPRCDVTRVFASRSVEERRGRKKRGEKTTIAMVVVRAQYLEG